MRDGHRVDVERRERRQRTAHDGYANLSHVADDLLGFRLQLGETLHRRRVWRNVRDNLAELTDDANGDRKLDWVVEAAALIDRDVVVLTRRV